MQVVDRQDLIKVLKDCVELYCTVELLGEKDSLEVSFSHSKRVVKLKVVTIKGEE